MQSLELPGRVSPLAALRFNAGAPRRVLALHGWLDNAMSFAPLAARLPDCEIIAIDLPGHGHSGHLPAGHGYHFIDYLDDALDAMDALGWPRCHLLGHSLGGAVASTLAAACPQRVDHLLLIEALGPLAGTPGKAAEALRQGIEARRRPVGAGRALRDLDSAVAARLRATPMQPDNARLLLTRNLIDGEDGLRWRSDPRLRLTSPLRADEASIGEWIAAIEAPTLLIVADRHDGLFEYDLVARRSAGLRNGRVVRLPGAHHLHMDHPEPCAAAIRQALAEPTPPA
ncbi:MAG: alpha/beta hydrolase [Lysobacteraceae bacterium]